MESEQKLKGGAEQIKDTRKKLLDYESEKFKKIRLFGNSCRDSLVYEESHDQEKTERQNMLVRNKRDQN